jgi:hypothetical protein
LLQLLWSVKGFKLAVKCEQVSTEGYA